MVEPGGERFVAFKPDRSGFLDPGSPYILAIDGRELPEWVDAAAPWSYLELTLSPASIRALACRKRPVPSMGEVFTLVTQENG